jgi:predicted lipoprotein with Yx(FWY)xxD motif
MLKVVMIGAALLLSTGAAVASGHDSAPPPPKKEPPNTPLVSMSGRGPMLTDPKGMTLYYFDKDDSGNKSNCNGKCNERWVPLVATGDAQPSGDFTLITRNDGSKMWAYRYRPLYTSQQDKAPGETNGAGASTQWHVARPAM